MQIESPRQTMRAGERNPAAYVSFLRFPSQLSNDFSAIFVVQAEQSLNKGSRKTMYYIFVYIPK